MLRIAICDNDKDFQNQLLKYISKDTDIRDDYVTECFDCILDVLKRLKKKNFNFDILFLMIDESGKDSIALIKYIREQKFDVDVFFVAKTADYITDAFRCKAFSYMVKPVEYKKFVYEIKQYLQEKKRYQKDYLSVMVKGREQLIPLNAVLYFTSDVRKIGAFFLNDEKAIWFYGKLDELEQKLKPFGYLRCHQSYLINIHKIEGIQGNEVITYGGTFPISRSYMNSVKEQWKYLKERWYHNANISSFTEELPGEPSGEEKSTTENGSTMVVTKNMDC